jgi:hypothetical protein
MAPMLMMLKVDIKALDQSNSFAAAAAFCSPAAGSFTTRFSQSCKLLRSSLVSTGSTSNQSPARLNNRLLISFNRRLHNKSIRIGHF